MYKDSNLSSRERAKLLLSNMTVDEKLDQMIFFDHLPTLADNVDKQKTLPSLSGVFGNLGLLDDPKAIDKIQHYFLNNTRLGIPLTMAFESLHGLYHKNATVFPQCAGLGGSFDKKLIGRMAEVIGEECRAVGVRQVFAPNIDVPEDARWGRLQEAYSEDPYLVGEMGAMYVKGVQKKGVAATLKHYVAYGIPESGLNLAPAHVGEREIREKFLEPFKKCIDAGAMSVMPAYNEVDGEPVHASKKLLRQILRDEMGFDGTVISDWGAMHMLMNFHFVAKDALTAGKMAVNAGVDIEAPYPMGYAQDFRDAVKRGEVDIKLIDEAVLRILELKFKLGLFEDPYADKSFALKMHSKESVQLARELDEKSILLLKNDGILPLDSQKIEKIAVIGNNAKGSFLGDYIGATEHCVDFYNGMVERLGNDRVLYARGCDPIASTDQMISEAINTAKQADVVMLVLGDCTDSGGGVGGGEFNNIQITCGEGYDTHDLSFPPSQKKLFDEIIKLGKPTVLVLYAGRPYTIMNEVEKVNGFMFSWGGGEQSGNAFANLIFGDKSPSAKLSYSFPQTVGHLPCYYNYKVSSKGFYKSPGSLQNPGRDYVLSSPQPWLPFGYGLSYTKLRYFDLEAEILDNGSVKVTVGIENEGSYEIDESVLLFVKMMHCPITPFVKKLRAFEKVNLKPGETKRVEFILTDEDFSYIDVDMKTVKNTGAHKIMIEHLECVVEL